MNSQDLIKKLTDEGRSGVEIQAALREGFDPNNIPIIAAVQGLSMVQEESLALMIRLYGQIMRSLDIDIKEDQMISSFIEAFRIMQDAHYYDYANDEEE
jgi:hypothetical protein